MKTTLLWGAAILVIVIAGGWYYFSKDQAGGTDAIVKIGFITPLTGDAAYWGESTAIGVKLAQEDLKKEGIQTEVLLEDSQFDPKVALSAAQKLTSIDQVSAIYAEFSSPAIAVSSFLKENPLLYLFSAAPVSPLNNGGHVFKTYLDYQGSCREVAQYLKSAKGITKIGVLNISLEYGDLCVTGIREVFGDQVAVEGFNPGTTDFRSSLGKLKAQNVNAVFNVSYQPETLASLKQMRELQISGVFAALSETITTDIVPEYKDALEGIVAFGLPVVDTAFANRADALNGEPVGNYSAAALGYIHTKQLARAIAECGNDLACQEKKLAASKNEPIAGFLGFESRVAKFDTQIQEWKDGKFVEVN